MKNPGIKIGSIGAVVLIVLASFTTIIGVAEQQTTQSSTVNDSPLYHIQTQRSMQSDQKDIATTNYLGKGTSLSIILPILTNKTALLKKVVQRMKEMSDDEFEKAVSMVIKEVRDKNFLSDDKISELIQFLRQIRNNPKILLENPAYLNENSKPILVTASCRTIFNFKPFCIILILTAPFWLPIVLLITILCGCA